jgi:hypothetical protein
MPCAACANVGRLVGQLDAMLAFNGLLEVEEGIKKRFLGVEDGLHSRILRKGRSFRELAYRYNPRGDRLEEAQVLGRGRYPAHCGTPRSAQASASAKVAAVVLVALCTHVFPSPGSQPAALARALSRVRCREARRSLAKR